MGKLRLLNGQLSVLELIEDFLKSVCEESATDYLTRGRVLMTLAKERADEIVDTTYGGFYRRILEMDVKGGCWELLIRLRTEARKLISSADHEKDEPYELIRCLTGGRVVISHAKDMDFALKYVGGNLAGMAAGEEMLNIKILDESGEVVFDGYGLKYTQFDAKRKTYLYTPYDCKAFIVNDSAFLVAAGIMYEMLKQKGLTDEIFEKDMTESLNFRRHGKMITLKPLVSWYRNSDIMLEFSRLYREEHEKIDQVKQYRESSSAYAKSYQTKANITQKVLKAMETSTLNQWFGFVEYDSETDLSRVAEFEKEFAAFHDICFGGVNSSKNSIRFRKLGSHRASGLYYPGVRCLVVDYRILTSTVHEYGHLIDYEMGCLSLKKEFGGIKRLYCEHLSFAMRLRTDPMYKQLKGKTKYSADYYKKPTEIFARSFELYCAYVLGVHNDLLPDDFSSQKAVYPYENERYMKAVTNYFNILFGIETQELKAV